MFLTDPPVSRTDIRTGASI